MTNISNKPNKQSYWFSKVDVAVVRDKTLPPMVKYIFAVLCTFADKDTRGCWPSNEKVADAAGGSVRTVIRAYKELEERGVIIRAKCFAKNQQTTSYTLIVGYNAPCYRGVSDDTVGVTQVSYRTRINELDIKDSLTGEANLPNSVKILNVPGNSEAFPPESEPKNAENAWENPQPSSIKPEDSCTPDDAPDIMRPTARYFLSCTGKTTLSEDDISALQELSVRHYPTRVQKEIDKVCERFRRKGDSLETLTLCYIASALRYQKTWGRKGRRKKDTASVSQVPKEVMARYDEVIASQNQPDSEFDQEKANAEIERKMQEWGLV